MRKPILFFSFSAAFLIFLSLFLTMGCQRELTDPGGGSSNPSVDDNVMVTGGLRGIVIDENNQPVMGATVTSGSATTTTDRYGTFRFNSISLSKANGYVKITKPGYFTGSRSFISVAGRIHNVRVRLLPKNNAGSFTATSGGTISLTGGGKLVVPADAITDAGGGAYTGTVNVAMTWIDPTAPGLPEIVPGDLRGITTAGEERGLETFGMLGVELTSTSGQVLKIANGKTAELTFPIPASIVANAPATIDMWNFNEATGRWKQEGTATKNGSNYIAQVSHFSFWNCDAQFPLVNLCMTLVSATGNQPLNNVQVRIKRPNGSYGSGWTDSSGNLCGKVPKDEALVLQVMDQCSNVVYAQNIGPFSADASLGTLSVTIPPANTVTITGTLVNCASANVTNGAAVIYTGGAFSYSVPVTNGTFSLTLLRCNGVTLNYSVLGIDYSTLQQGSPVSGSVSTGTVNVGTIQACGTSASQFVEYIIDGTPYSYIVPPDNILCIDSTGTGGFSAINYFYTQKVTGTNAETGYFSFLNNRTAGTYPLGTSIKVNNGVSAATILLTYILTPSPVVNITTYGPPVTGFIEGNFHVQMKASPATGTAMDVICNFRVRRN